MEPQEACRREEHSTALALVTVTCSAPPGARQRVGWGSPQGTLSRGSQEGVRTRGLTDGPSQLPPLASLGRGRAALCPSSPGDEGCAPPGGADPGLRPQQTGHPATSSLPTLPLQ